MVQVQTPTSRIVGNIWINIRNMHRYMGHKWSIAIIKLNTIQTKQALAYQFGNLTIILEVQ